MSSTTATASASASTSMSAATAALPPPQYKVVGVLLAVGSGLLIGSSFVFKKKGLIASQAGHTAGEGVAYLKSPMWWTGMTMMICGELCNFAAYAFVEAIVVTPLGALSVVICAILSSFFLNEKLSFFGWIGCALCIVGSVIIALNGPQEQTVSTIPAFMALFIAPGFLVYGGLIIIIALVIIFYFAPKYGKKNMLWYIMVCSVIGGLSVSCTQGLGAAIVTSIRGDNQLKDWFFYFLLAFVAVTLLTEIYFLNMALALFNTAMVTPTYYVTFTFFTLVTSVILYQGVKSTVTQILTIVLGFLVICAGITILQMSKVDPTTLKGLDRKSTILLQASRQQTEHTEKGDLSGIEDPGMDAIRGSSGLVGSIIRARSARKLSMSTGSARRYGPGARKLEEGEPYNGFQRFQLHDTPVPALPEDAAERIFTFSGGTSAGPTTLPKTQSIRFSESALRPHGHASTAPPPSLAQLYEDPSELSDPLRDAPSIPVASSRGYDGRSYPTAPPSQASFRDTYADPYSDDLPPLPSRRSLSSAPDISSNRSEAETLYSQVQHDEAMMEPQSGSARRGLFGRVHHEKNYPGARTDMDEEESESLVAESGDSVRAEDGSVRRGGIRLLPSTPKPKPKPGMI